ncbi:uncharacterized protein LOC129593463 [Paramacrobiotus metropolitanus]|uniref:uncharacterized protein LOC129593463 n=1 Tax=Paramacrobiotus metropolitanus TaxID=2943436 RepID=UPI002445724F|nr:uncharacterized protein LOC129593463 [Paramacrobiotus metropolitanus]
MKGRKSKYSPKGIRICEIFGKSYKGSVNVSYVGCDCCSVVERSDRCDRNDGVGHPELPIDCVLCHDCGRFEANEVTPFCPRSFTLNNLDPGELVPELQLGYMELQCVRLIFPFSTILFRAKRLLHAAGQFLHIVSDINECTSALLPRPSNECLLAVNQRKGENAVTSHYSVDFDTVYTALEFLRENNRFYENIILRGREDVLEQYQCADVLVKIDVHDSLALINFGGVIPEEFSTGPERTLPYQNTAVFNLKGNFGLEEKCYPNLFPFGKGGVEDDRECRIDYGKYFEIRLLSKDNRFQKDPSYVFRCLNVYQRELMCKEVNYVLRDAQQFTNGQRDTVELSKCLYPKVGAVL